MAGPWEDYAPGPTTSGGSNDGPWADYAPQQPGFSVSRSAIDVAKQIPSGLAVGVEAIPAFPAQVAGFVGGFADKFIPESMKNAPLARALGFDTSGPSRAEEQAQLRELTTKQQGGGIAQYLPKPETTLGQYARTGAEFVPAVVAGGYGSVPRAAGVGATTGLVSEAAGQATEGTPYEPYARVAGALVAAPMAARASQRAAVRAAAPTIEQAEAAGARGFEQFRASGFELAPEAAPTYATVLKTELQGRGLTPRTAGNTWDVLNDIERTPFTNPTQFQERYKELGSVARKATDGEERLAASIAQERLLGFLENPPAWVVQGGDPVAGAALLKTANADWAAAQRAKNISGRITKAEQVASGQYSGLGLENELRRRIGVLGLPPEATARGAPRGFTPEELARFQQFGEGTTGQNLRRYLTGAMAGRGGFAAGGLGVGGLATYLGTGDPITGGAIGVGVPAAGLILAKLGNRSALNRARDIERMLLARAPMAAGRMPQVQRTLPLAAAAPTLATLGQ